MFSSRKEDRPLGNEVKNKSAKKDPKYFQGLEYREIKPKAPKVNKVKPESELTVLPIGLKK
jgi:hypothetical protein